MSYLQPVTIQGQGIEKQKLPALRKDFGEDLVPKKNAQNKAFTSYLHGHLEGECCPTWGTYQV